MLRTVLTLSIALAAAGTCLPAAAQALVQVDVVDRDSGQWLDQIRHRGQHWIAGQPGHRYGVRLRNTTGERVLVVLSVDGVNAVTGQTAHPSQAGYVLGPWQSTEIAGWRKSLDDIAQFVFTDLPDSYAARTGRPHNVGVIGIAVFRERAPIVWREPISVTGSRERQAKAAAPAAEAADAAVPQRIGTGHGQREWSPVQRTEFVRASRSPAQVWQLRYDDAPSLIAMGVLPRWQRPVVRGPQAFPNGFVPDPPQW